MIGPLQAMGLTAGGLYVYEEWIVGGGRTNVTHGVHDSPPWYGTLVGWAGSQWPSYKGYASLIEAFVKQDLRQGLNAWGPISTDETIPAWSRLACKHVLDRWASIGEHAQLAASMIGGGDPDPSGTVARIMGPLDKLRHVRNTITDAYDTLFYEPLCIETERKCRTLASVIEGEGDYTATDPNYGKSYADYFVDELEERAADVGHAAGWVGAKLAGLAADLGIGAFKGLLGSPVGAAVLLGGAYLIYRRIK